MSATANLMEEAVECVPELEELTLGEASFYDLAEYFCARPHFALLDSRTGVRGAEKYSFMTFAPFMIIGCKGSEVWVEDEAGRAEISGTVFNTLEQVLGQYKLATDYAMAAPPFLGGGIGYFAYDLGRQLEALPANAADEFQLPDCYFCFYNFVIIHDHERGRVLLSYFDPLTRRPVISKSSLLRQIRQVPPGLYHDARLPGPVSGGAVEFHSDFQKQAYLDAINHIKEYILAGDVYQVNMTQRFRTPLNGGRPWDLYKRLMKINPSPFACYLNFDDVCVVSSSPERFLRVREDFVETRPIKGTVRRDAVPEQDAVNREWLLNSAKNRAELAMIVDLLRNDIGRVCEPGTIYVEDFPQLESYAALHHLVATITGRLRSDRTIIDLIKAAFPGGSITGAPKIRAMEIIDELEPIRRGIYTGSIGYIGFNRHADLNIVIRTIIVKDGIAHIQVGGGIVADSIDTEEYEETLLKAKKLFNAFLEHEAD